MSSEVAAVETWLFGVLNGDATRGALVTGVYNTQAPAGAAFPYVLFNYQAGHDVFGTGPARVMASVLYVVRVITDGPAGAIVSAAARLDELLQGKSGINVNGVVVACVRERPFVMVEDYEGVTYQHRGGIYRLLAQ